MNVVDKTIIFVKEKLQNAEGGHDWFHTHRVFINANRIAETEGNCNLEVVKLGALLHDIADSKFYNGDETVGEKLLENFLKKKMLHKKLLNM